MPRSYLVCLTNEVLSSRKIYNSKSSMAWASLAVVSQNTTIGSYKHQQSRSVVLVVTTRSTIVDKLDGPFIRVGVIGCESFVEIHIVRIHKLSHLIEHHGQHLISKHPLLHSHSIMYLRQSLSNLISATAVTLLFVSEATL